MNFMKNETAQKLRGGYYTPSALATFLARWVKEIAPRRILEPSCGDGAFFEAFGNVDGFQNTTILGFEFNSSEAAKASERARSAGLSAASVRSEDFLEWAIDNLANDNSRFDAVVGNPPFVRYQYLPEPFQVRAEQIFQRLALPFIEQTTP